MAIKPTKKTNLKSALVVVAAITSFTFAITTSASAAQSPIGLGTTDSFAVLAGEGITNTGPTTVSGTAGGDMGSSATTTFTGDTDVTTTGTKFTAPSALVDGAKDDLIIAYNDAAGRTPATTMTADLGGQTLVAGVYNSASSLQLTGTLTLDGQNDPNSVFIFQAGSTLTTASSSSVALINGAQACNVFWQVGSSATFGTTTDFVGHVFALTSITANNGATFHGQLLARNGAVTLDHNTIVNDHCAATTPSPEDTTDTGGQLPNTETSSLVYPIAFGLGLVAIGTLVYVLRRKRR